MVVLLEMHRIKKNEFKTLVLDSTYNDDNFKKKTFSVEFFNDFKFKIDFKTPSKCFASIMFFDFPVPKIKF